MHEQEIMNHNKKLCKQKECALHFSCDTLVSSILLSSLKGQTIINSTNILQLIALACTSLAMKEECEKKSTGKKLLGK